MQNNSKILNEYYRLVNTNKIKFIAFDGLDGSGKGTIVDLLSRILVNSGYNVIKISLPVYSTKYGKLLKHLLNVSDENLTLLERMNIYALNRLEITSEIVIKSVEITRNSKSKLFVVFDRFVTSNVITIAYYLQKHTKLIHQENIYLENIKKVDLFFINFLKLENTKIVVPSIDVEISMKRLSNDSTRKNIDMYEKYDVQKKARDLYIKLYQAGVFNMQIVPIHLNDSPETVLSKCLQKSDFNFDNYFYSKSNKGILYEVIGDFKHIFDRVAKEIYRILFEYPRINNLNKKL